MDPKDKTLSLVYGYIDMADAPSGVRWVSIRKYRGDGGEYGAGVKNGLFWHVGIGPGSYQVATFGGRGGIPLLTSRDYQYDFGSQGRNGTAIRVKAPGVYFMGAYKYVHHSGGVFGQDSFEMKPVASPGEDELLAKLVELLESDGDLKEYTNQIGMAKQRLATLSGKNSRRKLAGEAQ